MEETVVDRDVLYMQIFDFNSSYTQITNTFLDGQNSMIRISALFIQHFALQP